jgi:glycosyltransferase involved in cell wall biosynthesis
VVAGEAPPAFVPYQTMLQREAERDLAGQVEWPGHVSPQELARLHDRAAAFVMTTRAEACPNTALEAMRFGALCISTDCPPMPEFFRDGAVYYNAGSAAALAGRIDELLVRGSHDARTALRAAARARAADFTWSATADNTVRELGLASDHW